MKTYQHISTLEIDEIETIVSIDFESNGREVSILKMTDLESGDAICPDLLSEISAITLSEELAEFAANFEANKACNGRFSYSV